MALASEPQIMLLDEPASGLSRGERERLVELLHSLAPELTLLLIEHDMDVALRAAERVVVMADGVMVASRHARGDPPGPTRCTRSISAAEGFHDRAAGDRSAPERIRRDC